MLTLRLSPDECHAFKRSNFLGFDTQLEVIHLPNKIGHYFTWACTRQGYSYWRERYDTNYLSKEDKIYLLALLYAYHFKCQKVTFSQKARHCVD